MIATKDSFEPSLDELRPASRRVYVGASLHPDLRVPMREISLSPTRAAARFGGQGSTEPNEPGRVYDCSGPWGDPDFQGNVTQGLPALRSDAPTLRRSRAHDVLYVPRPVIP